MTRIISVSAAAVVLAAASSSTITTTTAFAPSVQSRHISAVVSASSSFIGRGLIAKRSRHSSNKKKPQKQRHHQLSMVIESLSDDCIAAVKEGHDIGNEIGFTELSKELLFAGMVRHPERARKTLAKYGIDSDEAKQAAIEVSRFAPGVKILETPVKVEDRQALPFSADSKLLLSKACEIAERMESPITRSEHVLLALMGYNNGNKIVASPIMNVLGKMKTISRTDSGFKVFNFCDDLVNDLPLTPTDGTTVDREAVVIGGGSGSTNTLAEVGVDMTQMAMEGKYDAVYGRDQEIRSVLRTLGRRRKNNPCLIGGTIVFGLFVDFCSLHRHSSHPFTVDQQSHQPTINF